MNISNDKRTFTYMLYNRSLPATPRRRAKMSPTEAQTLNYAYGLNGTELKWKIRVDEVVKFKQER